MHLKTKISVSKCACVMVSFHSFIINKNFLTTCMNGTTHLYLATVIKLSCDMKPNFYFSCTSFFLFHFSFSVTAAPVFFFFTKETKAFITYYV